jgi:hypothetical protein
MVMIWGSLLLGSVYTVVELASFCATNEPPALLSHT